MNVLSVSVTERGRRLAGRLPYEHVHGEAAATIRSRWSTVDGFVVFLAAGATVRIIGPLLADKRSEVPKGPQPLTPQIFKPVETLAAKMWPGVPVVPFMSAGATDGAFLTPAGIPTYGVSGMFGDPDGNGAHGLNERLRVKSVYDGRDFLYQVVKIYADQK